MEPKEYQVKCLERIKEYLCLLYEWRQKNEEILHQFGEEAALDFPAKAWSKLNRMFQSYHSRKDGMGRPLPCFCIKVPTGGGKTFLAVKTIDLINTTYLKKQTGLVLWVVPTTQIYRQTLQNLRNRDHPYRQHLDLASGGRTLIFEKTDRFTPEDVSENLCVLLLMLPSASRENRDVLRMFRDSGHFAEFFPPEDHVQEQRRLLQQIPNLDTFEKEDGFWGKQIKTSLGNTLRLLNPILILDEGHKAYSTTAQNTLCGFNPSIIVELSATPLSQSNVLVEITGIELNREEMIKLDLHVINKASPNWEDTLLEAHNKRTFLEEIAREYQARQGRYIRPICLIQVERTGREQRGGEYIHAEDVREHLLQVIGVAPEEVAVKTSEKDELKEVDDIGGLLSPDCKIRYIITKQALQEGWDCAFAYVLCVLTRPTSRIAMTQLVGRILRQPYAKKTGIKDLDESYVYCYQRIGAQLLEEIRNGLREEGLGDLSGRVNLEDATEGPTLFKWECTIRDKFKKSAQQVILPVFAIKDGNNWRPVSYTKDILSRLPWEEINLNPLLSLTLSLLEEADHEHIAALAEDVHQVIIQRQVRELKKGGIRLDPVFMTRQFLEIVPNPWVAYQISGSALKHFLDKYSEEIVVNNFVFLIEELRKHLSAEKDRLAEKVFRQLLSESKIRFLVILNEIGFRFPDKVPVQTERWLTKRDGSPLEKSLFDRVPQDRFNSLEQ